MSSTPTRYRIEYGRLVPLLLPTPLRKPRHLAWLASFTGQVELLYQQFLTFRLGSLRELSYNGQTIMLEKALNDKLDNNLRRIVIRNSTIFLEPLYINFKIEQQPPKYSHRKSEGKPPLYPYSKRQFQSQVGFIVYAPGLNAKDYPLNKLIQRYKIALVTYRIIYAPAPPL
jgi:hypothetical protein